MELALDNYGEAAAQGHAFLMDMLSYIYQNGEGIERDLPDAGDVSAKRALHALSGTVNN